MRNKIIIQKDDKSNTVVITDEQKYIEGVKRAISDSNKFAQLNINYIINVEERIKQLFKDFLNNDKISKDKYDKIFPKGSITRIICGNTKILKPNANNWPTF